MVNHEEYNGLRAFHPRYYVAELAEELGITQIELALRLGTTAKTVSQLINGKSRVSPEISMKLSRMTGTSQELWLRLQAEYDKTTQEFENGAISAKKQLKL